MNNLKDFGFPQYNFEYIEEPEGFTSKLLIKGNGLRDVQIAVVDRFDAFHKAKEFLTKQVDKVNDLVEALNEEFKDVMGNKGLDTKREQLKAFAEYLDDIHGGEPFAVYEVDEYLKQEKTE